MAMQGNDDNKDDPEMPPNYRASLSNGVYGSYVINDNGDSSQQQQHEVEEKSMDINDEINREIQLIQSQPAASRERIFNFAKQTYQENGTPLIIDPDDTLNDIVQNARNYRNVSLPLTLAMDKPFSTWNEQSFKQEFSNKFNIPISHIQIISVRSGSTIIDMKINTDSDKNGKHLTIECIAENITSQQAKKAFTEFKIFALEFGKVDTKFAATQQRVIMNPQWNKIYGAGQTHWDGALNDGKSRGGEPYYCPNGWQRFSIQFSETAYDFKNVYDNWPIAYHGTKFDFAMMISFSGLKATGGDHGEGVYLSPSIEYCAHPRYAKPIKLDLSTSKQQWTQTQQDLLSKYDGKWIQVVYACRVKPGSFIKRKETMSYWTQFPSQNGKFDNININEIEWIVTDPWGTIIGSDKILIYGIMIKSSDTEQTGY